MSREAKSYITAVLLSGLSLLVYELAGFHTHNLARFLVFFIITLGASGMKVRLPGLESSMSVNFLFVLAAVSQLSLPEVLVSGISGAILQCYWRPAKRPNWIQASFNAASGSLSFSAAYATYHWALLNGPDVGTLGRITAAAVVLFAANAGAIATVVALTENKSPWVVWKEHYLWSLPYYLVGAALVAAMSFVSRWVGWFAALGILPIMHLIYRIYRLYLGRLETEKQHAEAMAALHLRTIEALALAIDAKDHTTHDHLRRVQVYAMETGRELGLAPEEMQALLAASLLHDIGKLAVPEHIISKPGKLTPEEFDKMKIHPVVGAEILERVEFPYAVAPIVRSHHEKWNGTGYPDGLKGEEIPIGARILAAVDCLDALASDRQYRRALPLDEAMHVTAKESGIAFDPKVIEVLSRRYREFEQMANLPDAVKSLGTLSTDIRVERGDAPAAGFESSVTPAARESVAPGSGDPVTNMASAHHEIQSLYELALSVGESLYLSDTLSLLASRIKRLAPYDSLVVYLVQDKVLAPAYVTGEDSRLFSSLAIPMGEGLSGWVAENRKPIVNGNPSVEPGYLKNPGAFSRLHSALAIPLEDGDRVIGVLALYHSGQDAYNQDQLRMLQAVSSKLTAAIENSLKPDQAATLSNKDDLTALPNTRALFLHLDAEIARCGSNSTLGILVCDVDGFRLVMDHHGRIASDELLRSIALQLRQSCRASDYVARAGGEQFVVVMPTLTHAAAERRMRDFDRMVREIGCKLCGEEIVTLNCACVFFPADGATAQQLLAEADRRMSKHRQEHPHAEPALTGAMA